MLFPKTSKKLVFASYLFSKFHRTDSGNINSVSANVSFSNTYIHPCSFFIPFGLQCRKIFSFIWGELLQHSFAFHRIPNNPPSWQWHCCKGKIEENVETCARDSGLFIHLKKCWKTPWLKSLRRLRCKTFTSSSYLSNMLVYSLFKSVLFSNLRFHYGYSIMRN